MTTFTMLHWSNKTPMELGVPADRVDPGWLQGALHVKSGYAAQRESDLDSAGS